MELFLFDHAVLTILIGVFLTAGGYRSGDRMLSFLADRDGFANLFVCVTLLALFASFAAALIWKTILLHLAGITISSFTLGVFTGSSATVFQGHDN
ncbi:MAG: hypothetical protein K8F91_23565 [Candidatus Obscuribacterales bacterium]|nr:hypothetical protein [Candidatus Obscuribacterales bacterium]